MRDKDKGKLYDKNYFEGKTSGYFGKYAYTYENARKWLEPYLEFIKSLGYSSGKILDIGCAYGFFLKICEKGSWETWGIDISEHAIWEAKKYCNAKLEVLDVNTEKLPYPDNFFDVVTMFDVIEHVHTPENCIKEIYRVLKPNGLLYMITPNAKYRKLDINKDPTHINLFTKERLEKLIISNNFLIVKSYYPALAVPGAGILRLSCVIQWITNNLKIRNPVISLAAKKVRTTK